MFLRRAIVLCLCLAVVASVAACSANDEKTDSTGVVTSADSSETETETNPYEKFEGLNLDGFTFDVLSYDFPTWETYAAPESETGEVLNDAAYRRNVEIEELLNVKITLTRNSGYEDMFVKMVQSGDSNQADLVIFWSPGERSRFVTNNFVYDWAKVPYVDLEAQWYNQTANNAYRIAGKQYFAVSDYTFPVQQHFRILFNKQMAEDFRIPSLYDTVFAGKWTMDYMFEICKGIYSDLDGDGKKSLGDRYGIALNFAFASAFAFNAGELQVTIGADGFNVNLFSERIVSIVEKIVSMRSNPDMYVNTGGNEQYDIFNSGNALFLPYGSDPAMLRDIEFDFGYLMYPKFDETQKDYVVWSSGGMMSIPSNAADINATGAVIEALSIASNKYVKDAFIEMYIIGKVLRDKESEKIYRMMRDLATYDLSYNIDPAGMLSNYKYYSYYMQSESTDVTSYYAKISSRVTTAYEKLYEAAVSNQ